MTVEPVFKNVVKFGERKQPLGPGRMRAGFASKEYAARAVCRGSRWLASKRTKDKPPAHIAEYLNMMAKLVK